MDDSFRIEFEMEQMMCGRCKKSSSEYYELKLQLRFTHFDTDEDIVKVKDRSIALIEKNFEGINKREELDKGIDFYFRSLGEMNKISSLFNQIYLIDEKRSKKIVGHNFLESKDIWRHTLLINIINLEKKDHVRIKGKDYWIKAFNKNDMVLRGLTNGEKKVVTYSIVKDYLYLIKKHSDNDLDENLFDDDD